MDISTITHVTSDYIKNALEESAKASKTENRDFGSVFQSALGMVDETNELQNSAESAEIQFSLGESTNTVKWRYYKAIHTLKITLSNLSMFIITFVFGIMILKNDKKELPVIKEDQNSVNSNKNEIETENKENEKLEDSEIIQENEDFSENTIVEEQIMDTTNYLSIGMFSVSAIFLILTIIFSIFLTKHQLNAKKKASK